jgi:NADH-quinone oxidoreductase subunit G
MEGYRGQPPASLTPWYWSPGWNSVQSVNLFQEEIGGRLRGGDAGVRLLEPDAPPAKPSKARIPPAFKPEDGRWLLLPSCHVFGSEELSGLAPGVAELAPRPYVAISPSDAERLGVDDGDLLQVEAAQTSFALPVRVEPTLTDGTALLPVGIHGVPALDLPTTARLHPDGSQ